MEEVITDYAWISVTVSRVRAMMQKFSLIRQYQNSGIDIVNVITRIGKTRLTRKNKSRRFIYGISGKSN